ncbi:MAG: SDR family oxidoreductase [Bryobacteraceae bacterium]|nr:SDR family oxidoreductase [Bryobacteraceae bacterium]
MRIDLTGQTAVVTGGAHGIGLETARALRDCGARVVVADIEETKEFPFLQVDVTSAQSVKGLFTELSNVDIVVANAGIGGEASLEEHTASHWNKIVAVNLTGVFRTVQAAARRMKTRRRGAIVLTASTNSFDGERLLTAYNATKHGVLGILRTAANELGPYGIRINAVCPGFIRTRLTREGFDNPDFMREYARHLPLGRGGEPEEVARVIAFLASPLASYMTGAAVVIDGGQLAAKFGLWNEDNANFVTDHWELK